MKARIIDVIPPFVSKTKIPIGTEVFIIEGKEANGIDLYAEPCGPLLLCHFIKERKRLYIPEYCLEIIKDIDWEQRRYEIAKAVMCSAEGDPEQMAYYAVACADTLIAKLKKEKNNESNIHQTAVG
jgi:hypothetical protein